MRRETGSSISLDEVRRWVARGFADAFGVTLEHQAGFTSDEPDEIARLENEKYLRLYFPLTETLTACMAIHWQNRAFRPYMGRHILANPLFQGNLSIYSAFHKLAETKVQTQLRGVPFAEWKERVLARLQPYM